MNLIQLSRRRGTIRRILHAGGEPLTAAPRAGWGRRSCGISPTWYVHRRECAPRRPSNTDLAAQKIGATKKDDDGLDSPPPTPKSVVPPLSARVDYDLRTACALVLQDFKPSDYVYHERFGDADDDDPRLDRKTQLNYAAFMQALEDGEHDTEGPLDPVNTRQPDYKTLGGDSNGQPVPSLPKADTKSTASQQYRDGLWKRVRGEEDEVNETPGLRLRPAPSKPPVTKRPAAHKRSVSQPNQLTESSWKDLHADRPKPARANSLRTAGSSPPTDGTDHILAASTAPTTAAITPAQRASAGLGKPGDTEIAEFDGDWMRRELERHKQTQEEENANQASNNHIRDKSIALSLDTTNTGDVLAPIVHDAQAMPLQRAPSSAVKVPARKPVPRASVDGGEGVVLHVPPENVPSADLRRSTSRKRKSTPRSESRAELEILESARQSREQSRPPLPTELEPTAPVYRTIPRNTGVRAPAPSANVSKAPSRSRSITRQIREFVRRPSIGSRQPSEEATRPESRSKRSMDSLRSAVSANSWADNSSSKWKSWRPFHRNQGSTSSIDAGMEDHKGRNVANETTAAKTKPPINLNRELPPLPSLDQWKDEAPEPQPPVPAVQAMYTPNHNSDTYLPPTSQSRSQSASVDSTKSGPRARDSVMNETLPPLRIHPKRGSSLRAASDAHKYQTRDPQSTNGTQVLASPDAVLEDTTTTAHQSHINRDAESAPLDFVQIISRASSTRQHSSRTEKHMPKNALPRHIADFSNPGVRRVQSTTTAPSRTQAHSSSLAQASANGPTYTKSASMDQTRSFTDPYQQYQQPPSQQGQQQLNFSRKISVDIPVVDDGRFSPSRAAPAVPPKDPRTSDKEVVSNSTENVAGAKKKKWWLPGKSSSPKQEGPQAKRSRSWRVRS